MSRGPAPSPDYDPADPLFRRAPLGHQMNLPVLGVPVRFAASHPELLAPVEDAFGHWRGLDPRAVSAEASVDVHLILQGGVEDAPPEVTFRAADPLRWMFHTRGSMGFVDLERSTGTAWISRGMVQQASAYRHAIVGFMTLLAVTMHERTPMHAGLVAEGDVGLLLAGPTGSGKSTLAYAAARAGLRFLSDDAVYVQRDPWRIWREAPVSLLLGDVAQRYPDLKGQVASSLPGNRTKVVVPMDASPDPQPWVTRAGVCILERGNSKAAIEPIGPGEIRTVLQLDHLVRDRYGTRLDEVAERLAGPGGWRLTLSADPDEAIPLIRGALKEIAGRQAP